MTPPADNPPRDHDAPPPIPEYARTCARYVQTAVGAPLDFQPETLPLLDHYLRTARNEAAKKPEAMPLLAAVAGAYFGEVLRAVFDCRWVVADQDADDWTLEFGDLPIRVFPVAIAREALSGQADSELKTIVIEGVDRDAVAERLERLPQVCEEDYIAPSTRLEVIEIAVEVIRARRNAISAPTEA
jgi:hypothetical protein